MAKKGNTAKTVILSIAIALISVFFFIYAIQTIYPGPEREDFCEERLTFKAIETAQECETNGGEWIEYPDRGELKATGWCNVDFKCNEEYHEARDPYERNVFFVNLVIGIVLIVLGIFLALPAVSSGLMGGGVIMLIYGTIRNWGNLSDILRTIFLGIALIVLIWLGYRKLSD